MGLERSFDGLVWRGTLRGSAGHGFRWALIGSQIGLLLGIVAAIYAPLGALFVAQLLVAMSFALSGGAVGWAVSGAMASVDAQVRIDGTGITFVPTEPLPWELFTAFRAWPGDWQEDATHLAWEELTSFRLDPDGMAVVETTLGLGGRRRVVAFRMLHIHEEERRVITEVVGHQRLLAGMEGPERPPEVLDKQRRSRRPVRWRRSFVSFGRLRLRAHRSPGPTPVEAEQVREAITQLRERVHKRRDQS